MGINILGGFYDWLYVDYGALMLNLKNDKIATHG